MDVVSVRKLLSFISPIPNTTEPQINYLLNRVSWENKRGGAGRVEGG